MQKGAIWYLVKVVRLDFPADRRRREDSLESDFHRAGAGGYTSSMDRVRFGRALGFGARQAVKTLVTAVDAATAANPSDKRECGHE